MSSRPFLLRFVTALAGCVALAITGCKSSSLTLSASTNSAAAAADAGTPDAGGISLCGQLLVDRIRLVVRRIDLEKQPPAVDAGADAGADAGVAHCDCDEDDKVCEEEENVHVGPFLVDLAGGAVAGGIHEVFDVDVPAGTFENVRFNINTVSRKQAADGGLEEMKLLHASIAANGIFNEAPFQFTTSIHLKQKLEGPFTVGAGTSAIVLNIDPSRWFVGAQGQVLDPNDPRNRGQILANIRCSVRVSSQTGLDGGKRDFDDDEDEDRCRNEDEGDDDQGEHGSFLSLDGDGDHGGDHGGGDGDDGHRHACIATPLVCSGTPDGGVDAGVDGGH
jgi:hypothetical protein